MVWMLSKAPATTTTLQNIWKIGTISNYSVMDQTEIRNEMTRR